MKSERTEGGLEGSINGPSPSRSFVLHPPGPQLHRHSPFRAPSLHCALLPPTSPSGSSEIGACGPGRGRARAGLWGGSLSRPWRPPPRPSGSIWACPWLPTQAILGGSTEEEQGREEEERGWEKEGREGKGREGREGKESRPSKLASTRQPQSGISSKIPLPEQSTSILLHAARRR